MRTFGSYGCWLLLILLLGIPGCAVSGYVQKGPEVRTNTVTISDCKANPDTAQVQQSDTLTWIVDPIDVHSYSINFPGRRPVSSSTVPIGQGQQVGEDVWCASLGWLSTSFCVYSYNLVQNGKVCPDPGVHVVPKR